MPPRKEPTLLRTLALRRVADLSEATCLRISERHNCHCSRQQRYEDAAILRDHLSTYIRPFLDELCFYVFTTITNEKIRLASDIFLSAFMNEQMKTLTCRGSVFLYNHFTINAPFWRKQLVNVPNLVEFDLDNVDHLPQETFQILSEQCPRLEIIKFKFKVTTTQGIEHLNKIKSLRVIKDTGKGNLFNNERVLFFLLLEKLPKLEYINSCNNMGEVLSSTNIVSRLSLTKAWDSKPSMKGVGTIVRLCPQLKSIRLGRYTTLDIEECSYIVQILTKSTLQLESIKMVSMKFSNYIKDFFEKKGTFLRSLYLQNLFEIITPDNLKTIGKCCPLLEEFKIYNCHVNNDIFVYTPYEANVEMFEKLVKFSCNGSNPLPIQMCLARAKNITTIFVSCQFWNIGHGETGNLLTLELISRNALTELQSLYIDFYSSEFVLSQELIEHIFYSLPKLVKLNLLNMLYNPELRNCLEKLSDSIVHKNLDIEFKYSFEYV